MKRRKATPVGTAAFYWLVASTNGEVPPADAQATLRTNSQAHRLLRDAGIDLDRFGDELIRTRAEFNSIARLALEDGR